MKKDKHVRKALSGSIMIPLCFLFAFILMQTKLSAQGNDRVNAFHEYALQNPESPVVKYYKADPTNQLAQVAMKNAIVLQSSDRSKMSKEEIERLKAPIKQVKAWNDKAEAMVSEDMTYEHAIQSMQRQNKSNAAMKKATMQDQSNARQKEVDGIPVLVVPAAE